ncbi:MAG TPA: hypothetical protein VGC51_00685, partial [Hansschlegelia sp.]
MTVEAPARPVRLVGPRAELAGLVGGRADVGPAFLRAIGRLDARWSDEEIEAWAGGALALAHANLGGRCLDAFFRLAGRLPHQSAAALAGDARGAAEIGRRAGAKAALAALEAVPAAALRLPGQRDRACWWTGLARLAREAPDCVVLIAGQ